MEEKHLQVDASREEVVALLEVGQIYYLRGEYEKAEKVFQGALVMQPGDGDLLAALGATYHVQKKYELALACYEAALKACPSESCSKANRGELLLLMGHKEEAIRELKATIEQHGADHPLGERAAALLNLAQTAE